MDGPIKGPLELRARGARARRSLGRRAEMRQGRNVCWLSWLVASLFLVSCKARQPPPEYQASATVKDIMDSMIDPSADALWDSVATIVSAAGTEERAPHTDEEWTNVRHHAIQL